jgi:hypothetical protein
LHFLGEIMKARFVFACAASGIALMGFGAGTAAAEGDAWLSVSPSVIVQGDTVSLTATCADPDFAGSAQVESGALAPVSLTGEKDENGVWQLSAETTARTDVTPGPWSAMFQCGTGDVVVEFQTYGLPEEPYAAIGIDDDVIKPGQEVRVAASCQTDEFVSSKINSPVLTAPDLVREKGAPANSVLMSMGRIHADAEPGAYPISFTCGDREVPGEFTVVADEPEPQGKPAVQVPVKPKGAPETGSLEKAAPAEDSDLGVVVGAGAAALLVVGGVGVLAYRRRGRA